MCPIKRKVYKKQIRFDSWYSKQQYWHSHDLRNKSGSIFGTGQFHIHGFSEPYKFDRNGNGGGILLYIREELPSKLILTKKTTGFSGKFNLRKKWVLCCSDNPRKSLISKNLNKIDKNLDLL